MSSFQIRLTYLRGTASQLKITKKLNDPYDKLILCDT